MQPIDESVRRCKLVAEIFLEIDRNEKIVENWRQSCGQARLALFVD
jgi:hypothetical protein